MMDQRCHHGAISTHVDFIDIRRLNVVFARQTLHFTHGRVSEPEGKGLIDTPGSANVHGLPRRFIIASGSNPPPAALNQPSFASRISSEAVQPIEARSAATTPFSAACPAVNGFVMDPKLLRRPAACAPAIPSALAMRLVSSFSSFAHAAAPPNDPSVPVE